METSVLAPPNPAGMGVSAVLFLAGFPVSVREDGENVSLAPAPRGLPEASAAPEPSVPGLGGPAPTGAPDSVVQSAPSSSPRLPRFSSDKVRGTSREPRHLLSRVDEDAEQGGCGGSEGGGGFKGERMSGKRGKQKQSGCDGSQSPSGPRRAGEPWTSVCGTLGVSWGVHRARGAQLFTFWHVLHWALTMRMGDRRPGPSAQGSGPGHVAVCPGSGPGIVRGGRCAQPSQLCCEASPFLR